MSASTDLYVPQIGAALASMRSSAPRCAGARTAGSMAGSPVPIAAGRRSAAVSQALLERDAPVGASSPTATAATICRTCGWRSQALPGQRARVRTDARLAVEPTGIDSRCATCDCVARAIMSHGNRRHAMLIRAAHADIQTVGNHAGTGISEPSRAAGRRRRRRRHWRAAPSGASGAGDEPAHCAAPCQFHAQCQVLGDGDAEHLPGDHPLQQFLRVRHRQDRPGATTPAHFKPHPWSVTIAGEAEKTGTFTLEDSSGRIRSRSASTASAASRPGRW